MMIHPPQKKRSLILSSSFSPVSLSLHPSHSLSIHLTHSPTHLLSMPVFSKIVPPYSFEDSIPGYELDAPSLPGSEPVRNPQSYPSGGLSAGTRSRSYPTYPNAPVPLENYPPRPHLGNSNEPCGPGSSEFLILRGENEKLRRDIYKLQNTVYAFFIITARVRSTNLNSPGTYKP